VFHSLLAYVLKPLTKNNRLDRATSHSLAMTAA
jgi:hypothetical protein